MIRRLGLLLFFVVAACKPSGRFLPLPIDSAFARALSRDIGATTSLDSLGPRNWERAYIFGPYATTAMVRRCMQPSGGFEPYGIDSRDDIYVLYFRSPSGKISSMTLSRRNVRLAPEAVNREYPRGQFTFVSRLDSARAHSVLLPAGSLTRSCS
jgi:hypothetical protein